MGKVYIACIKTWSLWGIATYLATAIANAPDPRTDLWCFGHPGRRKPWWNLTWFTTMILSKSTSTVLEGPPPYRMPCTMRHLRGVWLPKKHIIFVAIEWMPAIMIIKLVDYVWTKYAGGFHSSLGHLQSSQCRVWGERRTWAHTRALAMSLYIYIWTN